MDWSIIQTKRITDRNITFNKLSAQWLNDALCFVSSSVLADSFCLLNLQLIEYEDFMCNINRPTVLTINERQTNANY
jgi:hypothetical protein